jgi:hypothetical protein
MEGKIFSTVYVSSATRLLKDAELAEILRVSRANNQRDEITGMLLYKDGNFMQVLEGPEGKVSALINKLHHDPRHRGIQQLVQDHVSERQFDQWAMAFHKVDLSAQEDREAMSNFLDDEVAAAAFRSNPGKAYRLLLSFRNNVK